MVTATGRLIAYRKASPGLNTPRQIIPPLSPILPIQCSASPHPIPSRHTYPAQPLLAGALVILPGIVEEIDSGIDRHIDHLARLVLIAGRPEVKPAYAYGGNLQAGTPQRLFWNFRGGVGLCHERVPSRNRQGC